MKKLFKVVAVAVLSLGFGVAAQAQFHHGQTRQTPREPQGLVGVVCDRPGVQGLI